MSYPTLTELTRSPASTRNQIEKNWYLFFPTLQTSYIHYDISPKHGRAFAKLLGSGLTTPNLTNALESPCLLDETDRKGRSGHWHQASNSLKLLLCQRSEGDTGRCDEREGQSVHLVLVHQKFSNELHLPMRYERYFVIFSTEPPFDLLAVSRYPILLANETASGWTLEENWSLPGGLQERTGSSIVKGDPMGKETDSNETAEPPETSANRLDIAILDQQPELDTDDREQLPPLAYFSYTPSINWARRQPSSGRNRDQELVNMQVGYLDDEIVMGVGLDDVGQGFAKVKARTLLSCLRMCTVKPAVDSK